MHFVTRQSARGGDLASMASNAAIALDNLVLGRIPDVASIKQLADSLSDHLKSKGEMDLTTAVALRHAIMKVNHAERSQTVPELLSNAGELVQRLSRVVADGESIAPEEIKSLRSLCVALSRTSVALAGPLLDRSRHQSRF